MKNGTSITNVMGGIESVVVLAMQNPDPKIKRFWLNISKTGDKPAPKEFLDCVVRQLI